MKIIYPNQIDGVVASSSNPDYPVWNLLDSKPLKVWKGTSPSGSLEITTSGTVNSLFLCNTNAETFTMTVKNVAGTVTYETQTGSYFESGVSDFTGGRIFLEFANSYSAPVKVTITLMKEDLIDDIYAGILRCGLAVSLPDPAYGLKYERQDYSVKSEFSNGGLYVYKRQTPRSYDINILATYNQFKSLDSLYNLIGSTPVAMLISEGLNDTDYWSGFFHILDPPTGSYSFYNLVDCSLSIREAI